TFSGIFWQAQIHTDFLSPFFFRQSFLNKIRVFAAKLIIWKADRIRVVSERIKKSLVEIGLEGKKIDVLPISIKAEEIENIPISFNLKEKYPGMDFIILMVSRITPEKNIRSAVAAFFEALKKRPKMKLVIAGEGPSLPDLKRETEKRGILKDVEFLGELTHEKAISAMKTADLFLSSSVYEGYGMTAVEAAAAGCPVLITDTGIAGEIIKDGESGTVVPVGSVLKMAEAIEVLAGNKEKREKMAERAKESVKNLMSKDEYLNKFKEILEK
ncbi:MAG: glycosyltransferase family 4 protein, partial [Candidatus Paceibacterota bacterium]